MCNNITNPLQQQIRFQLLNQNLNLLNVVEKMGYVKESKREKAVQRLQNALFSEDLGLSTSGYDFKYSNHEFICTLCEVSCSKKKHYEPQL